MKYLILIALFLALLGIPLDGIAQRGCCSWHGGVAGCRGGYVICRDGTPSPTCRCGLPQPEPEWTPMVKKAAPRAKKARSTEYKSVVLLETPTEVECSGFIGESSELYSGTCREAALKTTYHSGKTARIVWQAGCPRKVIRILEADLPFTRVLPETWGEYILGLLCADSPGD